MILHQVVSWTRFGLHERFSTANFTPVKNTDSIFVAGHRGLVGGAIVRELQSAGYTNLLLKTRAEVDLIDPLAVRSFFEQARPQAVIIAAAKVGGIKANSDFPVEFLLQNLQIQNNLIAAAADLARPGDTVLLAPAGASFDQFSSYADRGDSFAAAVQSASR